MVRDVAAQVVADRVGVPAGRGQQVLQPARTGMAGVLGDRPTIRPAQPGQQPRHQVPGMPAGLDPAEPGRDPAHQLLEPHPPPVTVYDQPSSHRRNVFMSLHKP
jgi:hypothetical protein